MDAPSDPKRRGRKLDDGRTAAILESARKLLREGGYDAFRVKAVASDCGCGLTTIYRRWPTKVELIADAIRQRPPVALTTTGDPVADLRALVSELVANFGIRGDLLIGLLAALQREPVLHEVVSKLVMGVRAVLRQRVVAVVGREDMRVDGIVDLVPGALIFRGAFGMVTAEHTLTDQVIGLALVLRDAGVPAGG